MSKERSRPWQNPTPLPGFVPEWAGQFDTFDDWVNHASRALTGFEGNYGEEIKARVHRHEGTPLPLRR